MALLDEWMEQKVDEACEAVPAYVNPRKIRLASSHAGWRLYLYGSSIKRAVCGFFVHIKTADDMDLFLRETAERSDTISNAFSGRKRGCWRCSTTRACGCGL